MKPDNILFVEDTLKLADFGLSSSIDSSFGTHCGSRKYAPPEVHSMWLECTEKVDIWSMGVTLFKMLSGELPFNTIREILTGELQFERSLWS